MTTTPKTKSKTNDKQRENICKGYFFNMEKNLINEDEKDE